MRKLTLLVMFFMTMSFVTSPVALRAETQEKILLETQIRFSPQGVPQVTFKNHQQSAEDDLSNKIQAALIFYAYIMNQMDSTQSTALLNEVQKVVGWVATDEGLKKPNFVKNHPKLPKPDAALAGQGFDLIFSSVPGRGNRLEVKPLGESMPLAIPAVLGVFQELVNTLPENGLRLMVLAMGGMNKWYRELGKASDPDSVAKAPAYGLNLAVDILAKVSGKNI